MCARIDHFTALSGHEFSLQVDFPPNWLESISRRKASKLLQNSQAFSGRNEVAAGRIWSNQVRDLSLVIHSIRLVGGFVTLIHVGFNLRLVSFY